MSTDTDPRCDFCERRLIRIVRGVAVCEKHLRSAPAAGCTHEGCHAGAVLVTNHGRRLCGNPEHIAASDGERLIWQVGTGSRPPAEWWLS